MQKHILITSIFTAAALFTVAGCSQTVRLKPPMAKQSSLTANRRLMMILVWCRTKCPDG